MKTKIEKSAPETVLSTDIVDKQSEFKAVILALLADYEDISYVRVTDLNLNDSVSVFRESPVLLRIIPELQTEFNFHNRLQLLFEKAVMKEDKAEFYDRTRRSIIFEQLDKAPHYNVRFRISVDGKGRYFLLKFTAIRDSENKIIYMIAGIRNIDFEVEQELERKIMQMRLQYSAELEKKQTELEEAVRVANNASKAKSNFLFNMSHDIRTPMNVIMGFTNMAKKHIEDKAHLMNYLEKISGASAHLLRLINDVLDMAQIESGKLSIEAAPCNIMEYRNVIFEIMNPLAERKDITFTVKHRSVVHKNISIDIARVEQILINIISNAIKYTPQGGKVSYVCEEIPALKEGMARFRNTVTDNGIGINEAFLEHIFDVFSRERNTTESGIMGVGLGMAIVKRLIDLMGGSIIVDSTLGKGTKVTVELEFPFLDQSACDTVFNDSEDVDISGMKILLVDDNVLNREIAIEVLHSYSAEVFEADDGVTAFAMVSKSKPGDYDAVLMDIQMPIMNGYEATELIRQLPNKELAEIPIIAMTANVFEEDKQKAENAGMNAHLGKPIDVDKLVATLAKFKK